MTRWLASHLAAGCCILASLGAAPATLPTDDPAAACKLEWTSKAKWANLVNVSTMAGANWDEKIAAAQEQLGAGGGVIYLPAGIYELKETVKLKSGVILRGANPTGVADARDGGYILPAKLVFPKYVPTFQGAGTPVNTAFKGIELADPHTTTGCGVVNLDIDHGHVKFGADAHERKLFEEKFAGYGGNHIVYGCILRNAAIPDPRLPAAFQEPWQRWTHRHNGAIDIRARQNVLVANNRIPKSGDDDFAMKGYKLNKGEGKDVITRDDIVFRYDNRPAIYVNYGTCEGTPESHPWCFARGIVIRNNFVYNFGCMAIGFSGDGAYVGFNVIRYEPRAFLPIYNGVNESHHVNNNRAVEMRGWRWTVEGNEYEVYSNIFNEQTGAGYNDGEGLMHESFGNVGIVDSKLIDNVGNRYLSIWRTPVDGLLIQGNRVRPAWGQPAICVLSEGGGQRFTCRNVKILDNVTENLGIQIVGKDCIGNEIKRNRAAGPVAQTIDNRGAAEMADNVGYQIKNEK